MTYLIFFSLLATLSPAFGSDEFGGIKFHSTVERHQADVIKNDLKYLYETPFTKSDAEFLSMGGINTGDGKNLHNWLVNRVEYILGESFELTEKNYAIGIVQILWHRFPKTPLPAVFAAAANSSNDREDDKKEDISKATTVMSNLGGALYLTGKKAGILLGIKFDEIKVLAKSARVGILQVGEGLFLESHLLNKDLNAPSNKISRLGTLFHEARHSDGTGVDTGFLHEICPKEHPYAGNAACETKGNGPYTIGALSERHLMKNCTQCSEEELAALQSSIADSFSRVINTDHYRKRIEMKEAAEMYNKIVNTYKDLLEDADSSVKPQIEAEIKNLENLYMNKRDEFLKLGMKTLLRPEFGNANPEGKFKSLSLKDSVKIMNKSLK